MGYTQLYSQHSQAVWNAPQLRRAQSVKQTTLHGVHTATKVGGKFAPEK